VVRWGGQRVQAGSRPEQSGGSKYPCREAPCGRQLPAAIVRSLVLAQAGQTQEPGQEADQTSVRVARGQISAASRISTGQPAIGRKVLFPA
jgi:hypothetical protein